MFFLIAFLLVIQTVYAQSIHDTIQSGETKDIYGYKLHLVIVSDKTMRVIFSMNGEYSDALREKSQFVFKDGSKLSVMNILPDDDGNSLVEFFFMPAMPIAADDDPVYDLSFATGTASTPSQVLSSTDLSEGVSSVQNNSFVPECKNTSDCADANACTTDSCVIGLCQNKRRSGCSYAQACVPVGTVIARQDGSRSFCTIKGNFSQARPLGGACSLNLECESNICLDGQCSKPTSQNITTSNIPTPQTPPPVNLTTQETKNVTTPILEKPASAEISSGGIISGLFTKIFQWFSDLF